jgi:hypothetical protein
MTRANMSRVPATTQDGNLAPKTNPPQTSPLEKDASEQRRLNNSLKIQYLTEIQKRRIAAGTRPINGFSKLRMPLPEELTISNGLVKEDHPFYEFITKASPLTPSDFEEIVSSKSLNLKIPMHHTGAIPASEGSTHQAAWTRDMAAVGLGWQEIGDYANAALVGECLYRACSSPTQREKIQRYLEPKEDSRGHARGLWYNLDARQYVPHIKFDINEFHDLVDLKQDWGMQQLDAFGYKLLLIGKLLEKNKTSLMEIDSKHDNESTVIALSRMLSKLEFWDNLHDSGAWENKFHQARLSSIAAALSGIVAIKDFLEVSKKETGNISLKITSAKNPDYNLDSFIDEMNLAIQKTSKVLKERINPEKPVFEVPSFQDDGEQHHYDAALAFILVLSDADKIGLNGAQQAAILRSVYSLMGEVGFRRFPFDPYMGMNWTQNPLDEQRNPQGEVSNINQENYRSAEWSMFDPYLAVINYKMFKKSLDLQKETGSPTIDYDAYYRGDMHYRRFLASISPKEFKYTRQTTNGPHEVVIPKGEVQEAWWYLREQPGKRGVWIPGENYGLNWTKIAGQVASVTGYLTAKDFEYLTKANELPVSFANGGYYTPLPRQDVLLQ